MERSWRHGPLNSSVENKWRNCGLYPPIFNLLVIHRLGFSIVFHALQDISAVIVSCEEVQQSKKFKGILEVILAIGNYINGGTHRGAAYGFKLDALIKLQVKAHNRIRRLCSHLSLSQDTKATDNRVSLLHYVVQSVMQKYPELLTFPKVIILSTILIWCANNNRSVGTETCTPSLPSIIPDCKGRRWAVEKGL